MFNPLTSSVSITFKTWIPPAATHLSTAHTFIQATTSSRLDSCWSSLTPLLWLLPLQSCSPHISHSHLIKMYIGSRHFPHTFQRPPKSLDCGRHPSVTEVSVLVYDPLHQWPWGPLSRCSLCRLPQYVDMLNF